MQIFREFVKVCDMQYAICSGCPQCVHIMDRLYAALKCFT